MRRRSRTWNRRKLTGVMAVLGVTGPATVMGACGTSFDVPYGDSDRLAARPALRCDVSSQEDGPAEGLPTDILPWTLIVVPDTQYYAASYPDIFATQTRWIVENRERLNIQMVMHAGDLVDSWDSPGQWGVADVNLSQIIDAGIPYTPTPGDHDHQGQTPDGSTEYFYQHFPETRFRDKPWWGGDYNDNTNHYVLLTIANDDYVFIGVDFCPSADEVGWAYGVLSAYSDRKAILMTHALLDDHGNYYGASDCSRFGGDTSFLWNDLIRHHKNLQLVLCGHMHLSDGECRQIVFNDDGLPVHQVMADYQARESGGNGRLRIMTFYPSLDEIRVQTYSPWTDTYETDANSEFVLQYPMQGPLAQQNEGFGP